MGKVYSNGDMQLELITGIDSGCKKRNSEEDQSEWKGLKINWNESNNTRNTEGQIKPVEVMHEKNFGIIQKISVK